MKLVSVLTSGADGGAEYAAVALLDALASRGHECVLLTNRSHLAAGTAVRVEEIDLGPKLGRRTVGTLALRTPLLLRRMRAALEAEMPYDVLLLHYKKEQLLALALPPRLRPRMAWAEWGPVPLPLRTGVPGALYSRAARRVDVAICISESARETVVAAGVPARRAHVVPNVVPADHVGFRPETRDAVRAGFGIPHDAFVVGCLTRLHPKKRNDVLVDAVIALDDPGVHLVLVGEGETEDELRARALPLGERVHFLAGAGDRAAELISSWDVAAFAPSPTEGAPRAIVVAMLCERPLVSTAREGAADLVAPGTGVIVEPEHDVQATARALGAYRADPDRCRADGAAARRHAAALHDSRVIAERVEKLLDPALRSMPLTDDPPAGR